MICFADHLSAARGISLCCSEMASSRGVASASVSLNSPRNVSHSPTVDFLAANICLSPAKFLFPCETPATIRRPAFQYLSVHICDSLAPNITARREELPPAQCDESRPTALLLRKRLRFLSQHPFATRSDEHRTREFVRRLSPDRATGRPQTLPDRRQTRSCACSSRRCRRFYPQLRRQSRYRRES